MKHETACFIITVLFHHFRHRMYINYFHETKLIFSWLCNEEALDPAMGTVWPNIPGADICSSCLHLFGITIGGRLRAGCCHCENARDAIDIGYTVTELSKHIRISRALCELLLCHALLSDKAFQEKWFAPSSTTTAEPQQHSTSEALSTEIPIN
jgi:hypothetical protein